MQIHTIPVFSDNYVWLIEGENKRCAVVDLGDAQPVMQAIASRGLTPVAILLTHHHHDHTGGIPAFLERYDVPVIGPSKEANSLVTQPQSEGDHFVLDGIGSVRVLDTPGHTLGGISFYMEGAVFTGDTLFTAGSGRLFEGTAQQMLNSLDKLARLPNETQVYCGHEYTADSLKFALHAEPDNDAIGQRVETVARCRAQERPTVPASMALEKATNPFLRVRDPALRHAIERHAGGTITDDAEALAVLRRWKDDFDGLAPL